MKTGDESLRRVLRAMSEPRGFWLLGAGASAGLVPFTSQMAIRAYEEYVNIGSYSVCSAPPDPDPHLRVRLTPPTHYWDPTCDLQQFYRDLFQRVCTYEALQFLTQEQLCVEPATTPPSYKAFTLLDSSATLFTPNLDGLTRTHCSHLQVFEPHGTINSQWFAHKDRALIRRCAISDGIALPDFNRPLLPGPEPHSITRRSEYVESRQIIATCSVIFIVGYSFGLYNGKRDDSESFEFFVDAINKSNKRVFVFDLCPRELVESLRDRLKSRDVYPVEVSWPSFAGALLQKCEGGPLRLKSSAWVNADLKTLEYIYHQIEDGEDVSSGLK